MIKRLWDWLATSSKDPRKYSLTIKAIGVLIIPKALSLLSVACGFGFLCLGLTEQSLNQVVENITAITEGVLYAIGGILFLWGFIRKVGLTIDGQHTI